MPVIYLVHYISKPGGLEVLMPAIINGMQDRKIKVFVIRPSLSGDLSVYKGLNVEIRYGSNNTFVALLKFFFFVLGDRKGIYHLFNTGPYFLFVLRFLGIKRIVYSIHGTIYWKTKLQMAMRKLMWVLSIKQGIIFTSNSQYSANVFRDNISKRVKPLTLYNPIDTAKFNLNEKQNSDALNKIIYVGRLVKGKNFGKWISAVNFLINKGVNATFEIYGTGPYEQELQKQIQAEGLGNKVYLKGYKKEIQEVYKKADLLLFLSSHESFGNVVVESVLCGTPVLTFDIPSMKEIFMNQPQFLIKNDDQYCEEIFNKVKMISELKNAALNASVAFSQRFSSIAHISKLKSVYNEFA